MTRAYFRAMLVSTIGTLDALIALAETWCWNNPTRAPIDFEVVRVRRWRYRRTVELLDQGATHEILRDTFMGRSRA